MTYKKAELDKFRKILEDLKAQINHLLQGTAQEVKEIDEKRGYSQHQADEGTDDFGKTISMEVSTKGFQILRQIDRALEKIDEGTFGVCDITGKEIPKARQEAIPYATMTVEAQQKLERGEIL